MEGRRRTLSRGEETGLTLIRGARGGAGEHQGAATPNEWQTRKLGDLCKTGSGGTPLKAKKEYYDGGTIPWLMSGEVSQGDVRAAANFITQKGLENSAAKMFPKDTVLVAMYGATAGQVGILRFEAATNQAVCGILPNKHFVPEFLFYFLLSRKDELMAQAAGNAQPNISQIKIRNTDVPVVPLPEQQRIVGILDEAFEGIATAKANAEKNLQNARALFESHLQSAFTLRGAGWVEQKLGEIAEVQSGGTPLVSNKSYWGGDIPWYSSGELNSTFTTQPERCISEQGLSSSNAKVFPRGSLLVGMYDTAALKMSILDRDGAFNQAIAGVKPNAKVDVEFVLYAICAIKPRLLRERRGVRQKNLSLEKIRAIEIPLPEPDQQSAVVAHIRRVLAETQRLESIFQGKLTALDALKKSLLHQAFTGHL
jgi:type I restriction enzyme S subunit